MIHEHVDRLIRAPARGATRRAGFCLLAGAGVTPLPLGRQDDADATAQNLELNQFGWGFSPGQPCVNNAQCDNRCPVPGIPDFAENGGDDPHRLDIVCRRNEGGPCGGR